MDRCSIHRGTLIFQRILQLDGVVPVFMQSQQEGQVTAMHDGKGVGRIATHNEMVFFRTYWCLIKPYTQPKETPTSYAVMLPSARAGDLLPCEPCVHHSERVPLAVGGHKV